MAQENEEKNQKNQKCRGTGRALLFLGLPVPGAGFLLMALSIESGIVAVAAGLILAGSGFILLKKPEYLAVLAGV